jgi:3-deoxy-D-manno-octulosonate 8-phosphate phosphatase (KDO 8-P phosphatase)
MTLEERFRRIRCIVCDVDGVLTDGSVGFDGEGKPFRVFNVHDVTGMTLWRLSGGLCALVSGLGSRAMEAVAERWHCTECRMWVKDKARVCREIATRHAVSLEEMAYIGDDIIDLGAMESVGLAVTVADGVPQAKQAAHVVTKAAGGHGALRELVELLLTAQNKLGEALDAYRSRKDEPQ